MRASIPAIVPAVLLCLALAVGGPLAADDALVYRVSVAADAAQRDWLSAAGFDIAGLSLERNRAELITDGAGLRRLREAGFSIALVEVREGPRALEQGSHGESAIDGPLPDTRYHDPAEVEAYLEQVHADHPSITRMVSLGTSHKGRDIWALMVSDNASEDEDELAVLFNAAHHAREVMTPEVILDTIDVLTDGYGVDPDLTRYVDEYEIWCVPIVNPDGVAWVHEVDDYWRKNLRDNDADGTVDSSDGVDLNRNYEWGWGGVCGGSSGSPGSSTYRGPTEGSEPETQAMLALTRRTRPVFDVEYHSYGEDVWYAMSCDPSFSPQLSTVTGPDQSISRVIAEEYASRIVQADGGAGFNSGPYGYRVDGPGRDQQYHEAGAIAFVTEINSSAEGGFHPDYGVWRDPTVEGQRPGWRYLLERVGGPAVGGHVLDAVSGEPIDARVTLAELSLPDGKMLANDAETGRFHLIVVPGSYTLQVQAEGYEGAEIPVTVGESFVPQSIELAPIAATLLAEDDLEDPGTAAAWTTPWPGDTANSGRWVWGEPEGTHSGSITSNLQFGAPLLDRSPGLGVKAFATGNTPAAAFDADDVDGGVTTLVSPAYDLAGHYAVSAVWQRWFRKDASDPLDRFDVEVSTDGGMTWHLLDRTTESSDVDGVSPAWERASALLDEVLVPGSETRLRFRVSDDGPDNVVEGALDELRLVGYPLATAGEVSGVTVSDPEETVLSWDAVPGGDGAVYDVVRGELSALASAGGVVDLGALVCIENDSLDTTTQTHPDGEVPDPGQGRFYLVRFQLGLSEGGYGAASDGSERSGDGGCD